MTIGGLSGYMSKLNIAQVDVLSNMLLKGHPKIKSIFNPILSSIRLIGGKVPTSKSMPESARKVPKVKVDKEAKGIMEHLDTKKFIPISKQTFYCKDSRGDAANFGAPGGDFGEFLLALNCYSSISVDSSLDVEELFGKWLDERCSKERPFYLHTDRPALTRLFEAIGKGSLKDPRDLKGTDRELFINEFGKGSTFQGCGHLRLILEDLEAYGIKKDVFESLTAAFFKKFFKGDERVQFKIYETIQDGRALAVIYGPAYLDSESILCTQTIDEDQVFILNQHAVSLFRKNYLVPFFCSRKSAGISSEEMYAKMEEKGWKNAMMSANTLAGGKPIYRVDLE